MKIYCLENDSIGAAAKYTINYLLNRYGFFFDWISRSEEIKDEGLLLVYQKDNIQTNTSIPIILLGREFRLDELSENNIKWNLVNFNNESVPVFIDPNKPDLNNHKIEFTSIDLIANVYYHLARVEETHFQHPDDIDNNVEKSILFKHGKFIIPVVDILCNYFKNEIERIAKENNIHLVRKTFYPEGQLFGIALTHDVDFIRAFHPLKKILLKVLILLGIKRNLTIEKIEQRDKLTWGFDKLLSYYKENNLRATFFFMAKYIEGWHFRYRIASKKMRILIAKLKSLNHEIAFHPSRYAFETPKRYLNEKQKLEKISGISVSGLRHHYLRCLYPQLWQKATQLDLKYDAGMVHRRYNGFRAGTSFPFQTFDHKMQERIEIIEFSTIFFENTLPDKGTDYEASKKTISQLLETVKIHGGLLNILWHSNNIYQPKVYSDLWNFIVNSIKEEDAFNQPLIEQYDWHKLREKIQLQSFKKLNRGFTVKIALPDGINRFSLHVPENYNYKCDGKFSYDKIKKLLTVESNIPNSIISIEALAK